MKKIVLIRVDSRLIHGQVVTKWLQQSNASEILVVSDELEKDEFLQTIYVMAAPPNIKVTIKGTETVLKYWESIVDGNIMLLVPDLETLEIVHKLGLIDNEVQIGGLGGGEGKKNVIKNLNLSEKDTDIIKNLIEQNIKIVFQAIPEENPINLKNLIIK